MDTDVVGADVDEAGADPDAGGADTDAAGAETDTIEADAGATGAADLGLLSSANLTRQSAVGW